MLPPSTPPHPHRTPVPRPGTAATRPQPDSGLETHQTFRTWLQNLDGHRALHAPTLHRNHGSRARAHHVFPRGLPEHLVYFVMTGACDAQAHDSRWRLEAGSVCWIRPGTPFTLAHDHSRQTAVYRFRLAADPATDAALGPAVRAPDAWEIRVLLDLLRTELSAELPHRDERVRGLLLVLFTSVFRAAGRQTRGPLLSRGARRAITEYVDHHITARPIAADLAALVRLSPDYFTRVFRKTFGMPPRDWILHRRIHHAAVLLDESDQTITQVARHFGYSDSFLFSKQFKSVIGMAPQAYRTR
ncbi:helix-turn-helix transcriptional regulator [Streptomyces goshikiensis]|uniref:helix-turn-helix transcriptional regulator n=1 Tax=Streptomyces TaxID=1883 RepID=UPI000FA74278|nr:AraC family transcriptional regulator [Streptomyces sp. ADI91-18]RPK27565.1 Arabinose operon regulatory protein [Streptomyces sp. ADI91-18]